MWTEELMTLALCMDANATTKEYTHYLRENNEVPF
jgi:hypothetical protein